MSENQAVSQSTYDLLRGRLEAAAADLADRANALNERRLETFGASQLELLGTERVRTEANAVPRDVATVGDQMVFAYNVAAGIKSEIRSEDVFAVHHYERDTSDPRTVILNPNPEGLTGSALDDDQFHRDFGELHTYFKESQLQQLYRRQDRLLAVFRTGSAKNDIRVLRWQIEVNKTLRYLDARGERDHKFPAHHDAEWTMTTRADHVGATHVAIDDRIVINPLQGTLQILFDDGGEGTELLSDPMEHADQSLADCQISWAKAGGDFIILDVLPYGELHHRYYVINLLTHSAVRLDDLGQAFRQLPDGQGIIFPSGVYLKTGEVRTFDLDPANMELLEVQRSPNGEDVLYVFHERETGVSILMPYNVVRQEVTAPITCHGHTFFEDGTMVVFREEAEPTRIHPIQIWSTPFSTVEWYEAQPRSTSELDRIGNAALVRGIADALALTRLVEAVEPSSEVYGDLLTSAGRFVDAHHWSSDTEVGDLADPAKNIRLVAEQVIDEFERMLEIQSAAGSALAEAEDSVSRVLEDLRISPPRTTEAFIDGLAAVRTEIGHLHTVRERRQIDTDRVDELIEDAEGSYNALAQTAAAHLASEGAFSPYHDRLVAIEAQIPTADSSVTANDLLEQVDAVAGSMDVVAGTVSDLVVDDPRVRTNVLEQVSGVLAELNRVRAGVEGRRTELIESETGAAFATELGLFGQSIATAVGRAGTPEECDEALARLLLQLEQLETAGPRTDAQLDELASRRDQVSEALSGKRQQLVDDRQQRSERLVSAATRTLDRVIQRASQLGSADEINGFFAADPMVGRIRKLVEDLRELGEPVRADELGSRLGAARDGAARSLRDRQDLYDGDAVKLGRHRFSVDRRSRELTIVPSEDQLDAVLTGTELRLPVHSDELDGAKDLWSQPFASETADLYRSTFLAFDVMAGLMSDRDQMERLFTAPGPGATETIADRVMPIMQSEVDNRLDEGYDRGVHDVDAAKIAEAAGPALLAAGPLVTSGAERGRAILAWAAADDSKRQQWIDRGTAAEALSVSAAVSSALSVEVGDDFNLSAAAARYLMSELTHPKGLGFATTPGAAGLTQSMRKNRAVAELLERIGDDTEAASVVLTDFLQRTAQPNELPFVDEVAVALLTPDLPRRTYDADLGFVASGLIGQHPTLVGGSLEGRVDDVFAVVSDHVARVVPAHRRFGEARRSTLEDLRKRLRIDDLEPSVPEGFVRNQLIDKVYLPLIGDNLARQIGTVEDRTGARSGLLMLLSPPGYGKTTLVEYLADRLGMALVKVSGPGLGHDVTSLDPGQAPSATAAREIDRINLSFAVGTNVILYLDDIQHTNPEFLQRFISLTDGQRRIEGVWNGESRTFDLRGKRFAVIMAGNPYTESGERFQIPDMLANRADTYNLGDVVGGNDEVFARSYLENALTANPVLAPLAGSAPEDFNAFLRAAAGEPLPESTLAGSYSSAEINEMIAALRHLITTQQTVLAVNRQYIASAATEDSYRTEPPFLLQGSYRNMARLASKIVPAMTEEEVQQLLDDHYIAESQSLTGAAEANLLKLADLRGRMTDEQRVRWDEILDTFNRQQRLGGGDSDPVTRVVAAIEGVSTSMGQGFGVAPSSGGPAEATKPHSSGDLDRLIEAIEKVSGALEMQDPLAARAIDLLASTAAKTRAESDEP